ncbi:MAG TPA: hypothetical protein VF751_05710 [Chthoniobacterales bacterium]
MNEKESPRFYFALPRLLARLRGGDANRAEKNALEAWSAGVAIFTISYLYFAILISATFSWWWRGLMFAALAFLVWLFWLVVLYVNSLILKLLHGFGLFGSLPMRRGQSILIATVVTAMAVALVQRGSFAREIGAIWLTATAMNLVAAAILAFGNGDPVRQ